MRKGCKGRKWRLFSVSQKEKEHIYQQKQKTSSARNKRKPPTAQTDCREGVCVFKTWLLNRKFGFWIQIYARDSASSNLFFDVSQCAALAHLPIWYRASILKWLTDGFEPIRNAFDSRAIFVSFMEICFNRNTRKTLLELKKRTSAKNKTMRVYLWIVKWAVKEMKTTAAGLFLAHLNRFTVDWMSWLHGFDEGARNHDMIFFHLKNQVATGRSIFQITVTMHNNQMNEKS